MTGITLSNLKDKITNYKIRVVNINQDIQSFMKTFEYTSYIEKIVGQLNFQSEELTGEIQKSLDYLSGIIIILQLTIPIPGHMKIQEGKNPLITVLSEIKKYLSLIKSYIELKKGISKLKSNISDIDKNIVEIESSIESIIKGFIQCSLLSLQKHTIDRKGRYIRVLEINNPILINYSMTNIADYQVVVNSLYELTKKIDKILELNINIHRCNCIYELEKSCNNKIELSIIHFQKIIKQITIVKNHTNKDLLKLDQIKTLIQNNINNNHSCLCMAIKYILYPQIIKLFNVTLMDLDTLGCFSRKFENYSNTSGLKLDLWSFFIMSIQLLDMISRIIKEKLICSCKDTICNCVTMSKSIGGSSALSNRGSNTVIDDINYSVNQISGWFTSFLDIAYNLMRPIHQGTIPNISKCYCLYHQNRYYTYLISIILFVSSLVENIWTMDTDTMRRSIECLSTLITELDDAHFEINCLKLLETVKKETVSLYDINIHIIEMVLRILNIDKIKQPITHNCSCVICVNMKLVKNIQIFSKKVSIFKPIEYLLQTIQQLVTRCQMIKVYQYFADVIYQMFQSTKDFDIIGIINSINEISNIYSSFKDSPNRVDLGIINNCKCDTCTNGKITCLCINLLHHLIATLRLGKGENECKCHYQTINSKCNPLRIECECTKCCIICLDYNEIMNCLCCINKCCNESNRCCVDENSSCCENGNNRGKNGNDQKFSIFECQCKNIFGMIKKCSPGIKLLSGCKLKGKCCVQCLNVISNGVLITIRMSKVVSEYINRFNINNKLSLLDSENKKIEYVKCIYVIINRSILRMTKNNLLTSNSHPNLNTKNTNGGRNWGYDTHFEHQVTAENRIVSGDESPNLNNGNTTGINNMISFIRLTTHFVYYI